MLLSSFLIQYMLQILLIMSMIHLLLLGKATISLNVHADYTWEFAYFGLQLHPFKDVSVDWIANNKHDVCFLYGIV